MDAKTIAAISHVSLFNALVDLGDILDAAGMKDAATAARARGLDELRRGAEVFDKTPD